jgi:signal transduction histidine kinase
MKSTEELQSEEVRALMRSLHHDLVFLASSLKGRISPAEEEILANIFQLEMNLEALVVDTSASSESTPLISTILPASSEEMAAYRQEADSIAHAQAMQYARDLVKAIRQKKEHQRRLELTSQQLIRAEKLATVGQIAAAVAHELGNILAPLLMYAKLIYKETTETEDSEIAEFAIQITRIATRASNMLRQLVDAARSEPGMMIPVDLIEVINNTLTLLSPQIKKQGIKIEKKYPGYLPRVLGHPDHLEQVFINIGLNAFDAMPAGGIFTITLEPGNGANKDAEPGFITIRLSDTGIGIPPENIGLLFEPFFTTKERGAGSGLGLFVSHLIINQHGGAIEVESELGRGTIFIMKLPTVTVHREKD